VELCENEFGSSAETHWFEKDTLYGTIPRGVSK
jgi:hypothetical protein